MQRKNGVAAIGRQGMIWVSETDLQMDALTTIVKEEAPEETETPSDDTSTTVEVEQIIRISNIRGQLVDRQILHDLPAAVDPFIYRF
ncbi:hypothetical protein ACFSR7_16365 [Cohnella sp. GCM10020058]